MGAPGQTTLDPDLQAIVDKYKTAQPGQRVPKSPPAGTVLDPDLQAIVDKHTHQGPSGQIGGQSQPHYRTVRREVRPDPVAQAGINYIESLITGGGADHSVRPGRSYDYSAQPSFNNPLLTQQDEKRAKKRVLLDMNKHLPKLTKQDLTKAKPTLLDSLNALDKKESGELDPERQAYDLFMQQHPNAHKLGSLLPDLASITTDELGVHLFPYDPKTGAGVKRGWYTEDPDQAGMRKQTEGVVSAAQWLIPGLRPLLGGEYAASMAQQSLHEGPIRVIGEQLSGVGHMLKNVVAPDPGSNALDYIVNATGVALLAHGAWHGGKIGLEKLQELRGNPDLIQASELAGVKPEVVIARLQRKLEMANTPSGVARFARRRVAESQTAKSPLSTVEQRMMARGELDQTQTPRPQSQAPETSSTSQARNATPPTQEAPQPIDSAIAPPSQRGTFGETEAAPPKPTEAPKPRKAPPTPEQVAAREQAAKDAFPDEPTAKPKHEATGLANQVQDREALDGIVGEVEKTKGENKHTWQQRGKALVEAGHDFIETARQVAAGTIELTGERVGALLEGKRRLLNEVTAAEKAADAAPGNEDALKRLDTARETLDKYLADVQAGKGRWSDVGRALQAGTTLDHGNPAEVLAEARRRGVTDKATLDALKSQSEQLAQSRTSEIELKTQSVEDRANEQVKQDVAESRKPQRGNRGKTNREAAQERVKTQINAIGAALEKVGASTSALGSGPVITKEMVASSAELARAIGGLAKEVVHLGAATLEDVITQVTEHIKTAHGRDIDRQAIIDAYATPERQYTRTDIQKELASLKAQAKGASTNRLAEVKARTADLQQQLRTRNFRVETPKEKKTTGAILDEQAKQRAYKQSIEASLRAGHMNTAQRIGQAAVNLPKTALLTGHAGATMMTHSGRNWAIPGAFKAQAVNTFNAFKMASRKGARYWETKMQELEAEPDYGEWLRWGLKVGPGAVDSQAALYAQLGNTKLGPLTDQFKALSERGSRGMDALKLMRRDLIKKDAPKVLRGLTGDERLEAGKRLAYDINHATGHAGAETGRIEKVTSALSPVMLSSSLENARWAGLGDLKDSFSMAAKLATKTIKPGEKAILMRRVKRAAGFIAAYEGTLAANWAINKAMGVPDDKNVNFLDLSKSDAQALKFGNLTFSPLGGTVLGPLKLVTGVFSSLLGFGERPGETPLEGAGDKFAQYATGKLSPDVTKPIEVGEGVAQHFGAPVVPQNFMGQPLPFASAEGKDAAAARGKEALSWWEYLFEAGPLPAGGAARAVADELKRNTDESTMKAILKAGLITSILEYGGVRVGETYPKTKEGPGWEEAQRLKYTPTFSRAKDKKTGKFKETGGQYFKRKTEFQKQFGEELHVDMQKPYWKTYTEQQKHEHARVVAANVRSKMKREPEED
jgi:hypothetical protein